MPAEARWLRLPLRLPASLQPAVQLQLYFPQDYFPQVYFPHASLASCMSPECLPPLPCSALPCSALPCPAVQATDKELLSFGADSESEEDEEGSEGEESEGEEEAAAEAAAQEEQEQRQPDGKGKHFSTVPWRRVQCRGRSGVGGRVCGRGGIVRRDEEVELLSAALGAYGEERGAVHCSSGHLVVRRNP